LILRQAGKRFGFLDEGKDLGGMFAALHAYLTYAANVGVYSELHPYLSKILALLPNDGMSYMQSFTQQQIQNHLSKPSTEKPSSPGTSDFLTKLFAMHVEQPDKIKMIDIFTVCITNIGAGSDTTSVSLSGILYNLIQNPEIYQKVKNFCSYRCHI
jgi:Cytochrome P450